MKKIAILLFIVLLIVCDVVNRSFFGSAYFGIILGFEKLVILSILLTFCYIYILRQATITMYSYNLMTNLGMIVFLLPNFILHFLGFFFFFHPFTLEEIYAGILNSFAIHVYIMSPLVIVIAVMLVISNIVLVRREGARWTNNLGIILGSLLLFGTLVALNTYHWLAPLVDDFSPRLSVLVYFLEASFCLLMAYFECMMIATIICTLFSERYRPSLDQDYMIILGCKVDQRGRPLPILQGRLDRALDFCRRQEKQNTPLVYIPSGGRGQDECTSEASAMTRYLRSHQVAPTRIIPEDQSVNTRENMIFSKKLIDERTEHARVVFATTGYHVFRSGVIANSIGLRAVGIGAKAPWYFYNNALIREFVANLHAQKKQHLCNLAMLLLHLLVFFGIGIYLEII